MMRLKTTLLVLLIVLLSGVARSQEVQNSEGKAEDSRPFTVAVEGKLSSKAAYNYLPIGFGGSIRFGIGASKTRWGFDAAIQVITSWEDTLNLSDSPEPDDTVKYDVWIKRGTDLFFSVGPAISREIYSRNNFRLDLGLGAGMLANISAYDEIKESETTVAKYSASKTPIDVKAYIKPKATVNIKRMFLAYEYFAFAEYLEHTICVGITF